MAEKTEHLTTEEITEMERYSISFDGEKYQFQEYRYDKLSDAISYAKKHQHVTHNKENSQTSVRYEYSDEIKAIQFITSGEFATSKTLKTLGIARGSTVRAKHIGRDFMADIKNLVGGELKGYTELLAEGREEAIYRMQSDAVRLGANAIVSVRFTSSTIGSGIAEILAYGTAVIVEGE